MPKVIKKKPQKKQPVREEEVKSAALHAVDVVKQKQKQMIIAAGAVAVIVVLYMIVSFYRSSAENRAYSLETEGYNYFYGINVSDSMSAEERLKKAAELFNNSIDEKMTPTALYYLGNSYFNLGDFENAIKKYTMFTDRFSSDPVILPLVYQKLASAYFRSGQNDKALETLDRLSKAEKGIYRDTSLILEARYLESSGQHEKALEKYREIVSVFPDSPWSIDAGSVIASKEASKQKTETKK